MSKTTRSISRSKLRPTSRSTSRQTFSSAASRNRRLQIYENYKYDQRRYEKTFSDSLKQLRSRLSDHQIQEYKSVTSLFLELCAYWSATISFLCKRTTIDPRRIIQAVKVASYQLNFVWNMLDCHIVGLNRNKDQGFFLRYVDSTRDSLIAQARTLLQVIRAERI